MLDVLPGPANDALELDSGLLLPLVEDCVLEIDVDAGRVLVAPGFSGRRVTSHESCGSTSSPSSRTRSRGSGNVVRWLPSSAPSSTCGSSTTGTPRRSPRGRWTTSRTAAARGWCSASTSSLRRSTPSTAALPDHRVVALSPEGRQLDQELVEELAAEQRADAALGALRGLRRAHPRPPLHRRRLDRALRPLGRRAAGARASSTPSPGGSRARSAEGSGELESFSVALDGGLEYPHYTRPAEFRGWSVPEVLLSGDHGRIDAWRRERVRSAT